MSHVYCPECGFQNPEAANYCSKCGALLHTPESGEQTEQFSPAVRDELLAQLGNLAVNGPALVKRDGRWAIEDLGSLNGTFVNRRRVESATLEDGDEIQIGKYRLTFLQH